MSARITHLLRSLAVGATAALLSTVAALAEVASGAVGFVDITLLRDSDTIIAVPLAPRVEFTGSVAAVTAGADGRFTLKLSTAPDFTADQFKDTCYLRFETGARRGMYFTIVGNTADTLTLDAAGYDFATLAAGDTFRIRRFWTLATLFPPDESGTTLNPLTASTGSLGPQRRSQIIIPNSDYAGINLPAVGVYYFTADGWRQAVTGNPVADQIVLHPDSYLVVRQPATIEADAIWSVVGDVVTEDQRIALFTRAGGAQDNAVALNRPVDLKLAESGLDAAFTASTSTLGPQRRDQLLLFDNSVRQQNKPAAVIYYRVGGQWIKSVAGNPTANDDEIDATTGIVIRKYQNSSAAPSEWVNTKNY